MDRKWISAPDENRQIVQHSLDLLVPLLRQYVAYILHESKLKFKIQTMGKNGSSKQ